MHPSTATAITRRKAHRITHPACPWSVRTWAGIWADRIRPKKSQSFQCLFADGLDFEGAVEEIAGRGQGGAQKFTAGKVDVIAVTGIEHDLLGVAFLVAHAQVVAKSWAHSPALAPR